MSNTSLLDDREQLAKLDISGVLRSVEQLPEQIEQTWATAKTIQVPEEYRRITRVVVSGMGGSALGAHVIKTLYKSSLKMPLEIVNGYDLPGYVNDQTLVVLSSYSGTTEETLQTAQEAEKKAAKIAVITAGGALQQLAEKKGYPLFFIEPKHNPSNQPRMAIGYSVFGQLGLLHALGVISLSDAEVRSVLDLLRRNAANLSPEEKDRNTAKFLAFSCVDTMPILVSAEHLEGAAHVFNNQINENAKNMTAMLNIPEMNHHFMEGLSFPTAMKENVRFLFVNSTLYHPRVQSRFPLTREVAERAGFQCETIQATAKTKLEQVWEIIQLGAYTNFYLAMLNDIDPAPIPTVDWFKEQLGKV